MTRCLSASKEEPTMAQLIYAAYDANPEAMREATERALRASDVSREINDVMKLDLP